MQLCNVENKEIKIVNDYQSIVRTYIYQKFSISAWQSQLSSMFKLPQMRTSLRVIAQLNFVKGTDFCCETVYETCNKLEVE